MFRNEAEEATLPHPIAGNVRPVCGLAAVLFEVLFDFEGGHAAGAGGGDGLAVAAVLDVAAGEDAGDGLAVVGVKTLFWVRM